MKIRRTFALVAITLLLGALAPDVEAAVPVEIPDCSAGAASLDHSIRLGGNVGACPGSGIVVTAPKVTIDMAGFTILGNGSGAGADTGISTSQPGLTVKNGVVRDFDVGVDVSADKATISRVVVVQNAFGGITVNGDDAKVLGSTVSFNLGAGIFVFGSKATLDANTAAGNVLEGILLSGGPSKVTRNRVGGNGDAGIVLAPGALAAMVKGNFVSGNKIGVKVGGTGHKIVSNVVSANGDSGILDDTSTSTEVSKNVANTNGYAAFGAPGHGIEGTGFTGSGNVALGNEVGDCEQPSLC